MRRIPRILWPLEWLRTVWALVSVAGIVAELEGGEQVATRVGGRRYTVRRCETWAP